MKRIPYLVLTVCFCSTALSQKIDGFTPASLKIQQDVEANFIETVDFNAFKKHLKALTAKPHVAGSKANEDVRDYMAKVMKDAGWDVELYPYDIYMSKEPGNSLIELVTPVRQPLNQQEYVIEEDEYSADPPWERVECILRKWGCYRRGGLCKLWHQR